MINRVVLVGRLTRDPELRYTTNNIANLRFTVAVNRQFTNSSGERQADFIGCVAWRTQAENMARFLRKGALIGVDGRIETGSYQGQDGQMRYTTDVVADSVQFLDSRASGNANPPGTEANPAASIGGEAQMANAFPANNKGADANAFPTQTMGNTSASSFNSTIDISDDDLPF